VRVVFFTAAAAAVALQQHPGPSSLQHLQQQPLHLSVLTHCHPLKVIHTYGNSQPAEIDEPTLPNFGIVEAPHVEDIPLLELF
jgi:hypothetical protein